MAISLDQYLTGIHVIPFEVVVVGVVCFVLIVTIPTCWIVLHTFDKQSVESVESHGELEKASGDKVMASNESVNNEMNLRHHMLGALKVLSKLIVHKQFHYLPKEKLPSLAAMETTYCGLWQYSQLLKTKDIDVQDVNIKDCYYVCKSPSKVEKEQRHRKQPKPMPIKHDVVVDKYYSDSKVAKRVSWSDGFVQEEHQKPGTAQVKPKAASITQVMRPDPTSLNPAQVRRIRQAPVPAGASLTTLPGETRRPGFFKRIKQRFSKRNSRKTETAATQQQQRPNKFIRFAARLCCGRK